MSENEIQRSLGRIEGGQTEVLRQLETIADRLNNHEDRLDRIDELKNKALGIAALVGIFASTIVEFIKEKLFSH